MYLTLDPIAIETTAPLCKTTRRLPALASHTSSPTPTCLSATPSAMSPAASGNGSHSALPRPDSIRGIAPTSHIQTSSSATQSQPLNYSSNDDSQTTTGTHDSDRVFTPPGSDSGSSAAHGNGNVSSQESQLLHLSQLAAAQEKMTEAGQSRKRMADGAVKHTRDSSSTSPVRMPGHSRNTSTVSIASTTGSRIGEVCLLFQIHNLAGVWIS